MWFFRAVAFDLDGTLTTDDRVSPEVLAAVRETRADRAVLLVTGRVHSALDSHFPGLTDQFDAVVTENGSVLRTALGRRSLHEPVDLAVDKALADRGVRAERGEVLVAIDGRDAPIATSVITELGLDHQVVHNRGSAMILPAGVTKGSALITALDELGLSPHNTIAVGDAENDLSLLRSAEVGVAVNNAVPSLAEHADLVLDRPNGEGVTELLNGPLLRGHERLCPTRRWVPIGWHEDDSPAMMAASQSSVLITGDTGAGKSFLAGLLAERWIDAGYAVLVIDPEGDHRGLAERAGVHLIDAAAHLPNPPDLLALMRPRHTSLVLDLSGLDIDSQLAYLRRMPDALTAERVLHGVPHWIIYEEAHQRSWLGDNAFPLGIAEVGACLVTWRPELLPEDLVATVEFTIALELPSPGTGGPSARGGTISKGSETQAFRVGERSIPHVRHRHKYAAMPLPAERRFQFRGEPGDRASAATLEEFCGQLMACDLDTLEYHLAHGDFSRWITGTLADRVLGTECTLIERDVQGRRAAVLEHARQQLREAIDRRYLEG
jgi:hydroxymethylpyrimidine pyrophosphatase-like HAD family hydrolase